MQIRLKILHIINSLTRGGAETLLVNSLTPGGLNEHADNYLVYFIKGDYLSSLVDKNVKQVCLNYKGGLDIIRLIRQLHKLIREHDFDIIHTHLNPSDFYVNLVRPKKIPQVHTVHIAYSTDVDTRPINIFLERKLYFEKKFANLIFLSEFTQKDFLDTVKFKGRSFVLNNFIDDAFFIHQPKQYHPSLQRNLKMVAVGNFRPQKNYLYLLEIFKQLKNYNITLDIYGGGGNIEQCRQVINEHGLNITLKGPVSNVNDVIAEYDVFIMPSSNEGFPLSVFEAMAAGVPVMLSDIAPLTTIVKDNAIYFKLNEAEKAAMQIAAIYKGDTDMNNLSVKAKQYAEGMVRRKIYIDKLLKIYGQVLSGN